MKKSIAKLFKEVAKLKERGKGSKMALKLARDEVNKLWAIIIGIVGLILTAIGILLSRK